MWPAKDKHQAPIHEQKLNNRAVIEADAWPTRAWRIIVELNSMLAKSP